MGAARLRMIFSSVLADSSRQSTLVCVAGAYRKLLRVDGGATGHDLADISMYARTYIAYIYRTYIMMRTVSRGPYWGAPNPHCFQSFSQLHISDVALFGSLNPSW